MQINILSDLICKRLDEDKFNIETQWSKDQITRFAVIDSLLREEIVRKIYSTFSKDKETCLKRNSFRETKSTLAKFENVPDILSSIAEAFQTEKVIKKVSSLVNMETHSKSWHLVTRNQIFRARYCISNYYFSQISSSGKDYFHVTAFMRRPEEKLKHVTSFFDNSLRQTIAQLTKTGRGKGQVRKK